MVQELRKTVRRVDTGGKGSLLTGKLYCADCGGKMHYRRSTTRAARDWRGIPNGGQSAHPQALTAALTTAAGKQYKQVCFSHSIKEDTVKTAYPRNDTVCLKKRPHGRGGVYKKYAERIRGQG